MEHDTSLWTTPYHDEKYGEELGASFKYFKEFLKQPTPRTLVGFHEVLAKILANNGKKRIPSYNKIMEYSAKWKWFKRAEAHDNYINQIHDEELQAKVKAIREHGVSLIQNRFKIHEELQQQLTNDNELNTNQKVYGFSKNSEGLKNDVQSLNELINEGKTLLDADVTSESQIQIDTKLSLDEREAKAREYFQDLEEEFKEK